MNRFNSIVMAGYLVWGLAVPGRAADPGEVAATQERK
jgi:hypothetical protein